MKDQIVKDREEWLNVAATFIVSEVFAPAGLPPFAHPYRISCGFAQGARRAIGMAFPRAMSADQTNEIYISPVLDAPVPTAGALHGVLETLTHEMIHALDDCRSKHSGAFRRYALRVGLVGPMKSTRAGTELALKLAFIAKAVGDYPHAKLTVAARDGVRQLKCECPTCGAIWRMSAKWRDDAYRCPCCASEHIVKH